MSEINEYLEQVKPFTSVSPEEAAQLLENKEGAIVYIGRETCPYCRKFVKKLSKVAGEKSLVIYYLHSQSTEYNIKAIQTVRDQYGVNTVPGLLVAHPTGVKVRCDSSMTEEEIVAFIEEA